MPTRSPAQELDLQEVLLCTLPTPAPVDTDRVSPRHRLRSSLMLSDCQSSWIQQMPSIRASPQCFCSRTLCSLVILMKINQNIQDLLLTVSQQHRHRSYRLEQRAHSLTQRHDHYFLAAGMNVSPLPT